VFENRVLRRIYGPKSEEEAREDCIMRNLCASPDIIRFIKTMRMRWVGHLLRLGEFRNAHNIFSRKI
jgi:hypothetical protein